MLWFSGVLSTVISDRDNDCDNDVRLLQRYNDNALWPAGCEELLRAGSDSVVVSCVRTREYRGELSLERCSLSVARPLNYHEISSFILQPSSTKN